MADHDESMASQVEDWIIAQIVAIQDGGNPVFEASEVKPWDGSNAGTLTEFSREFREAARPLIARVFFRGDRVVQLEEGEIKPVPQFIILIGMSNKRPAASRRGDGTSIGTNKLRDLLRYGLHDIQPLNASAQVINDGTTAVDHVRFMGSDVVRNDPELCIMQSVIEIDESEKSF
jgi:hypothetical protein